MAFGHNLHILRLYGHLAGPGGLLEAYDLPSSSIPSVFCAWRSDITCHPLPYRSDIRRLSWLKRPRATASSNATQEAATQQEQQCRCPRSFARSSSVSRTAKPRFVWPRRISSGRLARSGGSGSAWAATRDYLGKPNLFSLARGENHCGADAIAAGRQLYSGQTCEW